MANSNKCLLCTRMENIETFMLQRFFEFCLRFLLPSSVFLQTMRICAMAGSWYLLLCCYEGSNASLVNQWRRRLSWCISSCVWENAMGASACSVSICNIDWICEPSRFSCNDFESVSGTCAWRTMKPDHKDSGVKCVVEPRYFLSWIIQVVFCQ